MRIAFKLLSLLPLWLLHGMGWALGWLVFLGSRVYRQRFLAHAALAGLDAGAWQHAVGESGKLVAELPRLWLGGAVPVRWDGAQHIDVALAARQGIVFLTPHMGCFEVTAQAYAARYGQAAPMTVLFRPPRQAWLRAVVEASRARPGLVAASTTLSGVKQLMTALKRGQCVGILPDQVPPQGLGLWAPFFGRDAYTMTLSARLALQPNTTVLLAWGERLAWGGGYVVHVCPLQEALSKDLAVATTQINHAMEALVRQCPAQYVWGYARYKTPRSET